MANSRSARARVLAALGRDAEARAEFAAALAVAEHNGNDEPARRIRAAMTAAP